MKNISIFNRNFLTFLTLNTIIIFNASAQLNDLLRNINTIKQGTTQQNPLRNNQPSSTTNATPTSQNDSATTASSSTSKIDSKGMLNLTKSDFKNIWCASTDKSLNGPFDYNGMRPGDLCVQPEEIIDKLFIDGFAVIDPKSPRISTTVDYFKTKNFLLETVEIVYHPSAKKIYITSFDGAICKSDKNNTLNDGNNFRIALQSKYGRPSNQLTSFDVLKAQHDSLKADFDAKRRNAITVGEARNARDAQNQLDVVANLLKNPNLKNNIAQLQWQYSGEHKRPDNFAGLSIWETGTFEKLHCNDRNEQYTFSFTAPGGLVKRLQEIHSESLKVTNEENKKASVPKF